MCYDIKPVTFVKTPNSIAEGVGADEIVFASIQDQVYYVENDETYLLYDFTAEVGDTMNLRFPVKIDHTTPGRSHLSRA